MLKQVKTICFILGCCILIVSLSRNIFDYYKKTQFFNTYIKEYQKTEDENKKLKSDLIKSNDPYFQEEKIRNNLNLIKPNEIAVIIPYLRPTPTPSQTIQANWQKWISLFW